MRLILLPIVLAACATPRSNSSIIPQVDYHQHLVSPAFEPIVKLPARDGAALIRDLDAAGIGKAVVLSVGYSFADERKNLNNPDSLTRAENDWTSAQVVESRGRLVGFCSANPLRRAAIEELERCLRLPGMTGVKMHFGNAGVSLRNPDHAARMAEVFSLAERMRVPVLSHIRSRGGASFGAEDARLILEKLVPAAPSIEIIIAHFGGAGPGYPPQADEIMAVFGEAATRNDPRMRNIYFDMATVVTAESTAGDVNLIAKRIRDVGVSRIIYGSDLNPPGGSVRSGWEIFRDRMPLTERELRTIAGNLRPFVNAAQARRSDAVAVSPDRFRILLENDNVRVLEYSLNPGERDEWHTHPPKVSWVVSGGKLRITLADRIVLVEPKGGTFTQAERHMDPAIVNPTSIAVKLQNESVRVMEATLPPGYRETMHTHPGYVMYILEGGSVRLHNADGRTRDSEFKSGAVFYSDPITHWAENTGSTRIRVMIVELRRP